MNHFNTPRPLSPAPIFYGVLLTYTTIRYLFTMHWQHHRHWIGDTDKRGYQTLKYITLIEVFIMWIFLGVQCSPTLMLDFIISQRMFPYATLVLYKSRRLGSKLRQLIFRLISTIFVTCGKKIEEANITWSFLPDCTYNTWQTLL